MTDFINYLPVALEQADALPQCSASLIRDLGLSALSFCQALTVFVLARKMDQPVIAVAAVIPGGVAAGFVIRAIDCTALAGLLP